MNNADAAEVGYLEYVISCLDSLYEVGDVCLHPDSGELVSDGEYDGLRRRLAELCPTSSIFDTPTASAVGVIKKVKHDPPMTSISKASHEDKQKQKHQLFKWSEDCHIAFGKAGRIISIPEEKYNDGIYCYHKGFFYQSYKLDGVALAIYYKNGELVAAGLRPRNGVDGEDVTEQVKYVAGIPQKLNLPLTCSLRGELICKLSDFELVQKELKDAGEQIRANPRNHAAGGIRQFKDPSKVANMRLNFIAYTIEGLDNPPYKTEIERAKWCNKELGVPFIQVREYNFYDLAIMEKNVPDLDYEVDGVVIGVNDLEDQEQLGRSGDPKTGNPKGKIAWKFAEEQANPPVKAIPWETRRTGAIKPVAEFDAVTLAGTQVRRATLHNLGFIYRNKIEIGTEIIVLKAGKIIPKVIGVFAKPAQYSKITDVKYPHKCPSCDGPTTVKHTKAKGRQLEMFELMCENAECPAKNVNGLCHYLKTFGVLGLGDSIVTSLVEGGVVKKFSDFYKITLADVMNCGLSKREALLAIAGINMIASPDKYEDDDLEKEIIKQQKKKKVVPLWKFFASFGISSAGKSAGKALVDHFGDFTEMRKASATDLAKVPDVGEKTAKIVAQYLEDNSDEINELLKYIEPELPKVGALSSYSFVLTGSFAEGKAYWEKEIEKQGGKCGSSVSKNTSYVVVGVDAGSKEQKADALGIKKLTVNELKILLGV